MPEIKIENMFGKIVPCKEGQTILKAFHEAYVDWMQACGGKGRCTTCKCVVVSGMESLSPPSNIELKYLEKKMIGPHERLSCQAIVLGNIVVAAPAEYQLPHLSYGVLPLQ